MNIDIFICGGTIDKTYFPDLEEFNFNKTHIHEMISQARISDLKINIKSLFLKDSLDMNNDDRSMVVESCKKSDSKNILIVHGTSTKVDTAKAIANELLVDKTIVLFGSMLPYELAKSDALFNFGTSIISCQILSPGVYISMNGKVWDYDKVIKDTTLAKFLEKK